MNCLSKILTQSWWQFFNDSIIFPFYRWVPWDSKRFSHMAGKWTWVTLGTMPSWFQQAQRSFCTIRPPSVWKRRDCNHGAQSEAVPVIHVRGARDEKKRSWNAWDIGEDQAIGLWPDQKEEETGEAEGIRPHLVFVQMILHISETLYFIQPPLTRQCSPRVNTTLLLTRVSLCHQHFPVSGWHKPNICWETVLTVKEGGSERQSLIKEEADAAPMDSHPVVKVIWCPQNASVFVNMLSVIWLKAKTQTEVSCSPVSAGGGRDEWNVCPLASPQWQCSPYWPHSLHFQTNEVSWVSKTGNK